jgi:O-6-methylguanine DNA methyltransferase
VKNQFVELPIPTRDGRFTARYSEKGLAELGFPKAGTPRRGVRTSPHDVPAVLADRVIRWHHATEDALNRILAGREAKNLPPLDLIAGTDFQQAVWREIRKISPGKTKSYREIAQAIGKPKAVRAVGGACGANPIPVLVPCHRVLAAHGKIGGFGGGLAWKRRLLAREGVSM